MEGSSPASVIAAIMERPAPSIAGVAPPALDRAMKKCLAKDPDERWQTARDLKDELQWISTAPAAETTAPIVTIPARSSARIWQTAAAALAAIAAAAIWIAYRGNTHLEPRPLIQLNVALGPDVALSSETSVTLSPGGSRLLYISKGKLFTRKLDQQQAMELAGSDGAAAPFFSPDGKWVAFFAGGKLKKMPVDGGVPVYLCDAPAGYGGRWGQDGNLIISRRAFGALERISSNGGEPTALTTLLSGETYHHWPHLLPGGRAMLVTTSTPAGLQVEVVTSAGVRKPLTRGMYGKYLPTAERTGHLVYVDNGALFAAAFDPEALELLGPPVALFDQVVYDGTFGSAHFDATQNGILVYRSGSTLDNVTIDWLERDGQSKPLLRKPGRYTRPRLSPGGRRLALDVRDSASRDIWIYDIPRDTLTRLTFDVGGVAPNPVSNPVWTPGGRFLVFEGKGGMYWTRADGAGMPQRLTDPKNRQVPWSFSPDGKRLAGLDSPATAAWRVWIMDVEINASGLVPGKLELFPQSPADTRYPTFSPDGRWLAYTSNESGAYQVYVQAFPSNGGKWQVSADGGFYPVWSPSGSELFFRSADNRIMVADYRVNRDSFAPGKPTLWSEKQIGNFGLIGTASFDVAPDGKRVLALMPAATAEAQRTQGHVVFLVNFLDELRRRAPAGF
jgi:Tol biopolymer transport system component